MVTVFFIGRNTLPGMGESPYSRQAELDYNGSSSLITPQAKLLIDNSELLKNDDEIALGFVAAGGPTNGVPEQFVRVFQVKFFLYVSAVGFNRFDT